MTTFQFAFFITALTTVLVCLKLFNFITWSWWLVLAPWWITVLLSLVAVVIFAMCMSNLH